MANFCTRCGRKLEDGEVCNCRNENDNAVNKQPEQAFAGQPAAQQNQEESQQYQGNQQQYQGGQQYQGNQQQYQGGQQYQGNQQQYQGGQQYQGNQQQYQGGQQYQGNQQQYQGGQQYQGNQQQYQGNPQYYQNGQNQQYQGDPNQTRTREAEWFNQKKDAFVSGTKNMFSQIMPILKSPVTAVKNIVSGNSPAVGMELIVAKAVLILIFALIFLAKLSSAMGGFIEIPYFKIIILVLLLTVGADFLESLLMKLFSGVFNGITSFNAMVTTVGARVLYECFIAILVGILSLISVNVAFVIYMVCAVILPYIQYSGFHAVVQVSDDKKPYIFFIVKACMSVAIYIVVYLFAKDILVSMLGGMSSMFGSLF